MSVCYPLSYFGREHFEEQFCEIVLIQMVREMSF